MILVIEVNVPEDAVSELVDGVTTLLPRETVEVTRGTRFSIQSDQSVEIELTAVHAAASLGAIAELAQDWSRKRNISVTIVVEGNVAVTALV
jgi:hypothetical protein